MYGEGDDDGFQVPGTEDGDDEYAGAPVDAPLQPQPKAPKPRVPLNRVSRYMLGEELPQPAQPRWRAFVWPVVLGLGAGFVGAWLYAQWSGGGVRRTLVNGALGKLLR